MATNNKTSVLVENLLPDFLDTEGPRFQSFVKAYYEWMEQTGQMTDQSKNVLNNQDIDLAAAEFLKYFKREILSQFPEDILADKRLVYKKIKDLYRAKGSEESYKLLFRILYNEELDFYYPGQDILRASDGRWVKETSIRLTKPLIGNPDNLAGTITGRTSGATARVERVQLEFSDGIEFYEVFVNDVTGTFLDAELVDNTANTITGTIVSKSGALQRVIVTDGGSGHQKNDIVTITSSSGTGGRGRISITANGVITTIAVTNAGSGFVRSDPLILFNTTRSAVNATAAPLLTAPIEYTGRYTDVKGFISWSNKLQDNRYYQEYSYVLRSSQVLDTYKEIVKNVVHPAGMRLFGDVLINIDIDNTTTTFKNEYVLRFPDIIPTDIFIPTVVSASVDQYESSGDDGAIVPRPELEIEQIETFFDIDIPEAGSGFQVEIELIAAQQSALLAADQIISVNLQRLITDFTINTRTSNAALVQIGDVYHPNERYDLEGYSNTGALWLTANGYYLTPSDDITTTSTNIAVGLHSIGLHTILRTATLESINANTMTYLDLPIYALEDKLQGKLLYDVIEDQANTELGLTGSDTLETYDYSDPILTFPQKGFVTEPRLDLNTYSSEVLNGQIFQPPTGDFNKFPNDWVIDYAPTTPVSITSTVTFGTAELIDRTINGFTNIHLMTIESFAPAIIQTFQNTQLDEDEMIPTTTVVSANNEVT